LLPRVVLPHTATATTPLNSSPASLHAHATALIPLWVHAT
jgi:hypothetical protein